MEKLEIRLALPEDMPALSEIAVEAKSYWGYPDHWIELWRDVLKASPEAIQKGQVVVACIENEIVGFAAAEFADLPAATAPVPGHAVWQTSSCFVRPSRFRLGIGSRLMRSLVELVTP